MILRVLVTARDAAAALHLIEVVRAAASRPDLILTVVAQWPASGYFQRAGIEIEAIDLPPATRRDSDQALQLMAAARDILRSVSPDIVLCGLSTPSDGGLDEAVLAAYSGPSVVLQDFWGEANGFFGRKADLYLALDEEAVRLSRQRHGLSAIAVGSPRHSAYASLDIAGIRTRVRDQLGVASETAVFGFFGQALHALDGYRRTIAAWAAAVRRHPAPSLCIYRPHPRESDSDAERTLEILRDHGLNSTRYSQPDVEQALLVCDVVCSAFSNCSYDVAYLNRYSTEPLITPVSLFYEPDIVDYFQKMVQLTEFPYLKDDLVIPIREASDLPGLLSYAATPDGKGVCWRGAQRLPDPVRAPDRVLDAVVQHFESTRGATRQVMTEISSLRIAVVTTSRADFGLYQPIVKHLASNSKLTVGLIVSGMHLSADFGMTVNEVRESGYDIWAEAPCLLPGDTPMDIANSCGQAVQAIARALSTSKPDLVLVLGDRYEMLAAAVAASVLNIPLAHIHGGEETVGAYDNGFRYAISKLSHLHFPATQLAARRLLQMGEPADRVICCGAPGIDALKSIVPAGRAEFLDRTGLRDSPFLLATYHPETLALDTVERTFDNLWQALEATGVQILFTAANADTKGRQINQLIVQRSRSHDRIVFVQSLGHRFYASAMQYADVMVGNSSSGIIEAAYFRLPVVNIGGRQAGRERSANIIDCDTDRSAIDAALARARSKAFRDSLIDLTNVYGSGNAASCIAKVLERIDAPHELLIKPFQTRS